MAAPFINFYEDDAMIMNFLNALEEYGKEFAREYKERLIADDKKATGKLIDSIKPYVDKNWGSLLFSVKVEMEDYWKYVEKGLRGNKHSKNSTSPFPACADWRKLYPIILNWVRVKKLTTLPNEKSLAAAISHTISDTGISAGNQFEQTNLLVQQQHLPKLQEALDKDISNLEYKVWKDINKTIKI